MTFIRRIKSKSGTYLAEVRNVRVNGKVKQEFIRYVGKEVEGSIVRRVQSSDIKVMEVRRSLDVEIVHRISSKLGINEMIPKNALVMVYSQLLDRPAINRMPEYLQETEILRYLGIEKIDTANLYKSLQKINDMDFSAIEDNLADLFLNIENENKSVIIDVTDTYFTGDSLDSKPRKGKEGRIKKLIQIVLVVTERRGFPLFHRVYPGNISPKSIMGDVAKELWMKGYTAIIMDRGMLDPGKIKSMLDLKFTIICGLKKTPEFKSIIDGIDRNEVYTKKHMVSLKNTKVYCTDVEYQSGRLIIVYNPELEVLKKSHYYEHSSNEDIAKYLGYSIIYHNTVLSTEEVVKKYYDKDSVERAFKQMKGVLDLRPVRVWMKSHIEGHVKICYIAYSILSYLSYILEKKGISGSDALNTMRTGYRVYLEDERNKFKWESIVALSAIQKEIMDVVIKMT
ncbi:MAG: transposase [Thermoplasmata archaeon]